MKSLASDFLLTVFLLSVQVRRGKPTPHILYYCILTVHKLGTEGAYASVECYAYVPV